MTTTSWCWLAQPRSGRWLAGMTAFVGLVASAAAAVTSARWATGLATNKASFDPVEVSLVGVHLGGTLMLEVLGILVVSGEYSTGTIRATLAAAPRRPMVLGAKVLVFGTITLVAACAGFLLGQALLSAPAANATLSSPGALRAIAGTGFTCARSGC